MKSPLTLISFSSAFQGTTEAAIRANHKELFHALDDAFDVHIVTEDKLNSPDYVTPAGEPALVFIASGGTEGIAVRNYHNLPHPLVLLTDGKANSLAASLELSCWVRQQGASCTILHDEADRLVERIQSLKLRTIMQGQRIGVLGDPSEWLVASSVNYLEAKARWGVQFVNIPLSRVNSYFAEVKEEEVAEDADAFIAKAERMIEPKREDVIQAYRLYRAIRRIAEEERLNALTVKCFDLIPTTCTTGCLALALLNDEGIVAGCEGDLQSIFTMLLCKRLTGADAFMANPARIREKEVLFAHCTIGLHQTQSYIVRSHFESGKGVAIQGILREHQPVTVVKVGGKDLSRIAYVSAILAGNQNDKQKCRTQVILRTAKSDLSDYLLNNSIGNHHIILQGDYTAMLGSLRRVLGLANEAHD